MSKQSDKDGGFRVTLSAVSKFCLFAIRCTSGLSQKPILKFNVHFIEIMWNANLMQRGNFIDVFLALYVSGAYAHHQERWMLSCSIWFSAPSLWMGGGLESRCVGRVYGADGAVRRDYTAALKTTTHPQTRCRKPYAATYHLMLLMMGVCDRSISS